MALRGKTLILLLSLLWQTCANAALIAEVDRSRISANDSLVLTLRATAGEDLDNLNLNALEDNFLIGGTSSNTKITYSNLKREMVAELRVDLFPRRSGRIEIPSLASGSVRSQPIAIIVEPGSQAGEAASDVFLEAELDTDTVYLQAQAIYRLRIVAGVSLSNLKLDPLEHPDALIEELSTTSYQRRIKGRSFKVIERTYAIFPQRSGSLTLPSLNFLAQQHSARAGFMSMGNQVRRRTPELTLKVRPIPAAWPDATWLPARDVDIEDIWSTAPDLMSLGSSVTRTITLKAKGLKGNQLPTINLESVPGIRIYPDQAKADTLTDDQGVTGLGVSSAAMLVTAGGDYTLPAIRVPWWDTENEQLRYAEIPAYPFSVKAAAPAIKPSVPGLPTTASADSPVSSPLQFGTGLWSAWFWTTIFTSCGWALTVAWFWRRRPPTRQQDSTSTVLGEAALFKQIARACAANNADACRQALQQWSQARFASERRLSINEIATAVAEPELQQLLGELDVALYAANSSQWRGGQLLTSLKAWRKQAPQLRSEKPAALPPLYG